MAALARSQLYRALRGDERRQLKQAVDQHRRERLWQAGVIALDGRLNEVAREAR